MAKAPRPTISLALAVAVAILVVGAVTLGVYELSMTSLSSSSDSTGIPTSSASASSSANYTISTPDLSTSGMGATYTLENGTTISPTTQGCSMWFGSMNMSSVIFIPAKTLVWVQLLYPANFSAGILVEFDVFMYPGMPATNITLGVYASNGTLVSQEVYSNQTGAPFSRSGQVPNGTLNEVISLPSFGSDTAMPGETDSLAFSRGERFFAAIIFNEPLWILGSESSQPTWMVPGFNEAAPGEFTALPASLPSPSMTSQFELLVQGSVQWTCPI